MAEVRQGDVFPLHRSGLQAGRALRTALLYWANIQKYSCSALHNGLYLSCEKGFRTFFLIFRRMGVENGPKKLHPPPFAVRNGGEEDGADGGWRRGVHETVMVIVSGWH